MSNFAISSHPNTYPPSVFLIDGVITFTYTRVGDHGRERACNIGRRLTLTSARGETVDVPVTPLVHLHAPIRIFEELVVKANSYAIMRSRLHTHPPQGAVAAL